MGKYKGGKYLRIQYQSGLNIFWGKYSTTGKSQPWINISLDSSSSFYTVGSITKVGLKFIPLKNLSIGTDLLINLNGIDFCYEPELTKVTI